MDENNMKEKEINKKIKDFENIDKKHKKTKTERLNCEECNFTITLKQGLIQREIYKFKIIPISKNL